MKILVIAKNIGKDAAGLVYLEFVKNLVVYFKTNLFIIANNSPNIDVPNNNILISPNVNEKSERYSKLLLISTRKDYFTRNWEKSTWILFNKSQFADIKFDWVITFNSGNVIAPAILGKKIAEKSSGKLHVHLVDPIPPPKGWENFEIYRKALIYPLKPVLKEATMISSSNEVMLNYQLSQIKNLSPKFTLVLPNPVKSANLIFVNREIDDKKRIVFLGTLITGARNPAGIFEALTLLVKKWSNLEFHIYGSSYGTDSLNLPESISKKVFFHQYTNNIEEVIKYADILLDLDGNVQNDVFISSKLPVYLSYNRAILSITGPNSPSRKILCNLTNSAVIATFDIGVIVNSIETALKMNVEESFVKERNEYLSRVNSDYVTKTLIQKLEIKNINI